MLFRAACCLILGFYAALFPISATAAPSPQGQAVGSVQALDLKPVLAKSASPVGVWRHELHRPGAAFLKPEWQDLRLRPGDVLSTFDGAGRLVERLKAEDGWEERRRFWGLTVPGERLVLELTYNRPFSEPPFVLRRLATGDPETWEAVRPGWFPSSGAQDSGAQDIKGPRKSICAPAEFTDAVCHQADAGRWSAVQATAGILQVVGDDVFYCSGVNVSPRNLLLTAQSCIPDAAACADAEFVFGHYREACGSGDVVDTWQSYRCSAVVTSSPFDNRCDPDASHLDFALLQLDGEPAEDWGYVDPDGSALASGEGLYIVQHAGGRPLELSEGSGADVVVDGMTLRYYGSLDTEGSSVGAPIFRDADDRLVGLHHCGGCASPGIGNRGVRIEDIRPLIADQLCTAGVQLEAASAASVSQVPGDFGNGDDVLDPGETWQIVPRLRNVSCGMDTTAVTATFQVAAGSVAVDLLDTTSDFGAVTAGATVHGSPIRFRVGGELPCSGQVRLDLQSVSSAAGGFNGQVDYGSVDLGEVPTTEVLAETFDSGIPVTWTVEHMGSGSGEGSTWTTDDPGGRALFATPFAIVDSEFLGPGSTMDERLISPVIDGSGFTGWTLRFRHDFRWLDGEMDEKGTVDVRSSVTGGVWTELARYEGADASGLVELDLTAYAASDLQVRFRYFDAEWEWWWAVDDVTLLGDNGRVCFTGLFADGFESGDTSAWDAP